MHSTSQGFGVPLGPPGTSTPLSANLGSSSAAFASLVIFRVQVGESFGFGEDVYVCGNTPTLGNFDPERGVQLFATTRNYPFFESAVVPLPRGKPIEYKYAIFVGGIFDRWESIDYNRCITADELAQNTDTNMQGRMSSDMDSEIADIVTHMTNDSLGITPENPPDLTTSETLNSMTPTPTTVFGRHYSPASSSAAGNALDMSDGVIVVSYYLPVLVSKNINGSWHVEWDNESLLALKTDIRVTRIGTVRYPGGFVPKDERDALTTALESFGCVPIFLDPPGQHDLFYNTFCKQTLWPIFHNLLEIYGPVPTGQAGREAGKSFFETTEKPQVSEDIVESTPPKDTGNEDLGAAVRNRMPLRGSSSLDKISGLSEDSGSLVDESNNLASRSDAWLAYTAVQKQYCKKIMEIYQEGDLLWIHGFHLLLLPSYISRQYPVAKIGLFVHTPFPSSEIFRTLSRREEILRGMLSADQVGFHLYEYARHFLTCCRRLLGLEWTHDANGINIHYGGRSVLVTCIHAGMDQEVMRSISEQPSVQANIAQLMQTSKQKYMFAGVDRMERLKGVPLKLLAFERFLENHPEVASTVMLYEVSLTARERGTDYENTKQQVQHLVSRINAKYSGGEGAIPIVFWEEHDEANFQLKDRLALLSVADVFLDTTVRGGLNRWPLEFVLAQSYMGGQGSEYLPKAHTSGLMILSEFTSCMRVLQGALTVNPWKIDEVAEAMWTCKSMPHEERDKRLQMDVEYVRVHTTASWCSRVLQDLKGIKKSKDKLDYVGTGLFRVAMHKMKRGFEQLNTGKVVKAYRQTKNRLILLDYGGTLYDDTAASDDIQHYQVTQGKMKRDGPEANVLTSLRELCRDTRNKVYVLSGKVRDDLVDTLGRIPGLGLVAEAGYFYRRPNAEPLPHDHKAALDAAHWNTLVSDNNMSWKQVAEAVMQVYAERTHGVYIQQNESAVVWQFRDADPEFAMTQSKELEDQLKTLLKHLNVEIIRGDDYIEARPSGVSKAAFIQNTFTEVYAEEPPDFILCIGDDPSDEKSYKVVKQFVNLLSKASRLNPAIGSTTSTGSTNSRRSSISSVGSTGTWNNSINLISVPPSGTTSRAPPQYFTATVGMKPTTAENYLHQTDNVVQMLETMSKTRDIERSISMVNFQAPSPNSQDEPSSPKSTDSDIPANLLSIPEQPQMSGQSSGMGLRSMSMPNLAASSRNFSSMTLSNYFSNFAEEEGDDDDMVGLSMDF